MKAKTAHEALLALTLACEQVRRVDAPPDLFSALAEAREVLRRLGGYDARIPLLRRFAETGVLADG